MTFNEETLTASTTLDRATKDQPTTIQRKGQAEETRTSGSPTKSIEPAPEATLPVTPSIGIDVGTSRAMDPDVPAADDASALDTTQDGGSEATNTSTSGAEGDPTMSVALIATTAITGGEEPTITEPAPPEALATEDTNAASNDSAATEDRGAEIAVASQAEASTTPAAVSDSATALIPNDPVTSTPQPAAIPPPIIGARAPWEIGLVGGLFNTTSTYTGGTSDTWDVDAQRTPAFGAEMMHMGRNFGIGGGLHYGTYADRLITPEEYRTIISTNQTWSLIFVDTTVLVITGTFTDSSGQIFHTGQNVNITVGQLRSDLDSTLSSVRIREARERINRTSYFEVPLLLDAHLVQGRWSLGVRGGPTVGMLTQRQGSIPSDGEGYTDFNDVAMRTWTLGWTARAYVRYRFNSAWSVGIEPAARGQLMDSFEEQGITRRSNAIGCMLSLSYRLP
ncbi:MAG: hypothetical protein IPG92_04620 [Flavobacteriales bacterium]|nr:hypothetical protein [Flavobacteriales bacterium]